MTISAISGSSTQTPAAPSNQLAATTDSFLKLFMAQLQQQDPLNPQSGADMVGQLAQLSSVEQSAQTNQSLQTLVNQQSSSSNASLSNLVGRTCTATAGDFQITSTGGQPPALQLSASASMRGASVVITDAAGHQVAKLAVPPGTSTTLQWNGRNASGAQVPPGAYHVTVVGGPSNAAISASWQGTVQAVQLGNGATQLQIGDVLVDPSTIQSIGATASPPSAISPIQASIKGIKP
jgi:flagellar basal-body rod modification protein FlgD